MINSGGSFIPCSCHSFWFGGTYERQHVCYLIERELQPFDDLVSAKSQIEHKKIATMKIDIIYRSCMFSCPMSTSNM